MHVECRDSTLPSARAVITIYDAFPLESYFEDQGKSRAQLIRDAVKLIEQMADLYREQYKKP